MPNNEQTAIIISQHSWAANQQRSDNIILYSLVQCAPEPTATVATQKEETILKHIIMAVYKINYKKKTKE